MGCVGMEAAPPLRVSGSFCYHGYVTCTGTSERGAGRPLRPDSMLVSGVRQFGILFPWFVDMFCREFRIVLLVLPHGLYRLSNFISRLFAFFVHEKQGLPNLSAEIELQII